MIEDLKIYTVLVAYNSTKENLYPLVNELLKQSSFLVICNNSKVDLIYDHIRIKVLNFSENLGIARAQTLGMSWAYEQGADFVLQMDQDSLPDVDMVKILHTTYLDLIAANYNVGLIGPQDYDRNTKKIQRARFNKGISVTGIDSVVLVDATLSSGSLIPKTAFHSVGGMLDELFIDAVDFEYCWRLSSNGFVIARSNEAGLAHCLGEGRKSFLGLFDFGIPSPVRHYYAFRNVFYLFGLKYVPTYWKVSSALKIIFKIFFYPVILKNGTERLRYMLLGIKDGLRKKMYRIDSF